MNEGGDVRNSASLVSRILPSWHSRALGASALPAVKRITRDSKAVAETCKRVFCDMMASKKRQKNLAVQSGGYLPGSRDWVECGRICRSQLRCYAVASLYNAKENIRGHALTLTQSAWGSAAGRDAAWRLLRGSETERRKELSNQAAAWLLNLTRKRSARGRAGLASPRFIPTLGMRTISCAAAAGC